MGTGKKKRTKGGVDTMNSSAVYTPLNLDLLNNKQSKIVSSDSALNDVAPIPWNNEVLTGKKKVVLVTKEKNNGR